MIAAAVESKHLGADAKDGNKAPRKTIQPHDARRVARPFPNYVYRPQISVELMCPYFQNGTDLQQAANCCC